MAIHQFRGSTKYLENEPQRQGLWITNRNPLKDFTDSKLHGKKTQMSLEVAERTG